MSGVAYPHFYILMPSGVKEVYLECANFLYCRLPDGGRGTLGKGYATQMLLRGEWDITSSKERAEAHLRAVEGAR